MANKIDRSADISVSIKFGRRISFSVDIDDDAALTKAEDELTKKIDAVGKELANELHRGFFGESVIGPVPFASLVIVLRAYQTLANHVFHNAYYGNVTREVDAVVSGSDKGAPVSRKQVLLAMIAMLRNRKVEFAKTLDMAIEHTEKGLELLEEVVPANSPIPK